MGKTISCNFSEMNIYPGHGLVFIKKDGKLTNFINRKCFSLYRQKKKAAKLTWTVNWRKLNKKGKTIRVDRKIRKKKAKAFKGIAGVDIAALKAKMNESKEARTKARQQALARIKGSQKSKAKGGLGGGAKKKGKKSRKNKGKK